MRATFSAIVVASVLGSTAPWARAGVCLSEEELDEYTVALEAVAKSPAKARDLSEYWLLCLEGNAKREARITAACTAIVARLDVDKPPPQDESNYEAAQVYGRQAACITALAAYGVNPIKTRTRDVDYVGERIDDPYPPHQDPSSTFRTLARTRDPRVVPAVVAAFRANLAAVAKKPLTGWRAGNWVSWRRAALSVIEQLGTASELAFLDELAAATKDKRVLAGIARARAAIDKRGKAP